MDIEEMGYAASQGDNATPSRFILMSERPGRRFRSIRETKPSFGYSHCLITFKGVVSSYVQTGCS